MKTKGFSLIEFLVAASMATLIIMLVTLFAKNIFSYNSSSMASMTSQLEGRKVLKTMVSELRSLSPSGQGSYPIDTAATSTIIFYSDVSGDNVADKVRYFLDSTTKTIKRGVIIATGSPPTYTGTESISILMSDVTNGTTTALFDYFDKNFAGTTSPMSIPVDIHSVRLMRITAKIDKDPNRMPYTTTVTSDATLRNLKDNL